MALVSALTAAAAFSATETWAQQPAEDGTRFIRIGTGPTGGTYFPMGGLIANAISNPPGSRACDKGGSCGVPGLIAVAQSTNGAVDNVDAIGSGTMELALAQADVAYWAYHGTGIYQKKGAVENLRAIAMLFPESIHLVVRADSDIHSVSDLKGKRVALGEQGSGTLVDAKIILGAYGMSEKRVEASYERPGPAADRLAAGEIDAFFFVAAAPVDVITQLASTMPVRLIPIAGKEADNLAKAHPFMLAGEVPEGVYPGVPATPTLQVGAVLVCDAKLPDDLVYGITEALWHPNNRPLFERGHPVGKLMDPQRATKGMGIALHAGAAAYYFDHGISE